MQLLSKQTEIAEMQQNCKLFLLEYDKALLGVQLDAN